MCGLGPKEGIAHRCGNDTQTCRSVFKAGLTLTLVARPLAEPTPQPMFVTPEPMAMTLADHHKPMAPPPLPKPAVTVKWAESHLREVHCEFLLKTVRLINAQAAKENPDTFYERTFYGGKRMLSEGMSLESVLFWHKHYSIPTTGVAFDGRSINLEQKWRREYGDCWT
jgi:hypothetical protein